MATGCQRKRRDLDEDSPPLFLLRFQPEAFSGSNGLTATLKVHISGRVIHGKNPGPVHYLSSEEEALLADYLLKSSDMGYGKTQLDVCCIVESYLKQKGSLKGERLSSGWWDKVLQRNQTLRLHRGDSAAGVRLDAVNAKNMDNYFQLLVMSSYSTEMASKLA